MHIRNVLKLQFSALILLLTQSGQGARVFFTDQPPNVPGYVISVNCDGTDQRTITTAPAISDFRGIAYHAPSNRVYYLDNGPAKRIYSMMPDGTGQQDVLTLTDALNSDLEVDVGVLYWSETVNGRIQRAALDGSDIQTVVAPGTDALTEPYFIFLDRDGGYIYWGVTSDGSTPSSFRRATLAGEIDPDFFINSPTRTRDIAIDSTTATAYWCDRQTGRIYRRALTNDLNEIVIGSMNAPHGIALDVEAHKVYWADTGARGAGSGLSARRVARCNFDGSEFENISTPTATSEAWDLALDLSSRTYADWRTRFFSTTTPSAEPMEDADADGAVNLLEYAMGTHPRQATSIPRLVAEGTQMRYVRRTGSNLSYRVEVSTDLTTWHYNNDGSGGVWVVEISNTPVGPELNSVTVRPGSSLAGATQVFFRLRVTAP